MQGGCLILARAATDNSGLRMRLEIKCTSANHCLAKSRIGLSKELFLCCRLEFRHRFHNVRNPRPIIAGE